MDWIIDILTPYLIDACLAYAALGLLTMLYLIRTWQSAHDGYDEIENEMIKIVGWSLVWWVVVGVLIIETCPLFTWRFWLQEVRIPYFSWRKSSRWWAP